MIADRPMLTDGVPDPATPGRRLELARYLLLGAIRRYEEANATWSEIHESFPPLERPRPAVDAEELADRESWRALLRQADDDFNVAELALAERINNLYDMLAPEGSRAAEVASDYFVPRAIRRDGVVYVLVYSVGHYEPGTNIIAAYREGMVLDLDAEAPGMALTYDG